MSLRKRVRCYFAQYTLATASLAKDSACSAVRGPPVCSTLSSCDVYLDKFPGGIANPFQQLLVSLLMLDACNHRFEHSVNFRDLGQDQLNITTLADLTLLWRHVEVRYSAYFRES